MTIGAHFSHFPNGVQIRTPAPAPRIPAEEAAVVATQAPSYFLPVFAVARSPPLVIPPRTTTALSAMSLDTAFDLIGLVGSFIISVGLVPQVTKVYQTKSAIDFSYSFLAMYSGGLGLTVLYGVGENLWPIYIPCSMEFLGALMLLVMKVIYDKNPIVVTTDEKGERHHLLANVAAPRPVCKTCNCSCGGVTSSGTPASSARDTTTL